VRAANLESKAKMIYANGMTRLRRVMIHLLSLAIQVAEAHYAGASGAARLSETGRFWLHRRVLPDSLTY
jgi:hypothetical protein